MAIDFIHVNTGTTTAVHAGMLLELVRVARASYDQLGQILRLMGHMADLAATPPDFTKIEEQFGLDPGFGEVMFNLINGAKGSTEGVFKVDDFKTLTERIG
jgi:hypothetical protein